MTALRDKAVPEGVLGLSAVDALEKLAHGRNVLVPESTTQRWKRWLGPFADPMVGLLLVAIPVYLAIGEQRDAFVTVVALVPIIAIGWLMESRATNALAKLHQLTASTIWVIRDGRWLEVVTEELVPGDVAEIAEGSVVPADARVLSSSQLQVDESSLTGESLHVNKDETDPNVYAGTIVIAGRALIEVTATGAATRFGQIASLLNQTHTRRTPLQKSMLRLIRTIAFLAAFAAIAVFAAEYRDGHGWAAGVIAAISLLIAALPEEFSMVYSLYLALGAWRLAREKALVRNLPGVETLGSVTVICTDKTGTLTEGALELHSVYALDGDQSSCLSAAVLASEPEPFDLLDKAIVDYASENDVNVTQLHSWPLRVDWPFDPRTKHLTHVWQLDDATFRVASKGSLEGLLEVCQPGAQQRADLESENHRLASSGMRVIAVAEGSLATLPTSRDEAEASLKILGLIGLRDPIKPNVAEALQACRTAGIRVIVITGDHPTTATAVAAELGLTHHDGSPAHVAIGKEIDDLADGELDRLVGDTDIFARTRPDQKHQLITSLLRTGEVVAMTGDGVNDAPALRQADIGVVMGIRGTDVAREAATIVLLDDNFATIVAATRNGRLIYDNLSKAFRYLIAVHVPLIALALTAPLMDLPLILLPIHLIVLEVLLHPIVSLVFQAEPAAPNIMQRPPRRSSFALSGRALALPALVGLTVSIAAIGVFWWALDSGWPVDAARGAALTLFMLSQMVLLVSTRSSRLPLWRVWVRPTRELMFAWAALLGTVVLMLTVPQVSSLLAVASFSPTMVLPLLLIVLASTLWTEVVKQVKQ